MSGAGRRLVDRVAIVTGSARGLGLAIATRLLQEGCRVLVCDVDGDELEAAAGGLVATFGAEAVLSRRADVSKAEDAAMLVAAAEERWGRLDIVVNNAGIADFSPLSTITGADLDQVMAVNLDSVLLVTRAALPLLQRSPAGRVVNLSSILGFRVMPESIPYCTSKGAIATLTKCLAVELAPFAITVNAIAPGCFDTRMARLPDGSKEYESEEFKTIYLAGGRLPLGRVGRFEELAAAAFFLASDDSSYITGQTLFVDGGISVRF
ncbi:MAG: SDR family oxidoreductase [Geminicoccaceae bacterium]